MDLAFSTMAARSEVSPAQWRWPFLSWMDGIEEGWAIPLLLFGFIAVWFLFLVIAYLGGDLHSDVLETWTFGRSIDWGNSKHPPLMGWVARAWTSVFPLTNWSFQLMALANAALALWAVDLISRRFVAGDKRMIVLLMLMLLPVYQFHAQRFNANAVLLATWPIATYCFLRSFETREIRWALAAGAAGALAMLGKYYSVFLIVGFAFAALCHPQRRVYWTSWAPWVSIAAGLSALVPHLHWLLISGAPPFAYALARHTGKAFAPSVIEAALFILGLALVLALPAATWALMAKDRLRQVSQDFWAMNSGLLLLFLVGVGTIVFPVLTSIAFGTDMPPIWGLQGLFLFVILLVCGASYPIPRFYSVNLAVLVIGIAVVAVVVVAPVHAFYRNTHPLHEGRNFYSLAAKELTRRWHEQSGAPLAAAGGDEGLAFGMAFYSPDHPVYEARLVLPHSEALPPHATFRRGWAALCYDEDASCIASMERIAARAPRVARSAFVLQSMLLGQPGATQGFTALMVPPYGDDKIAPPPLPPVPRIAPVDSEIAPVLVRQDEPTCCAPRTDSADGESEFAMRPALPAEEREIKHARRAAPPPAAASPASWPDRAATSASRDGFARWPIPVPRCTPHGSQVGCLPAQRANALAASRGYGARPAYFCDDSGPSASPGSARMGEPVSVRLKRNLCGMAADFDAQARASQEKFNAFLRTARESNDRRMQLGRKDSKDNTTDSPRRRI
jgi:4-amino-4-deoxy-L-arabinose transferase-like glycosyltransferase